jgi:MFS family permease
VRALGAAVLAQTAVSVTDQGVPTIAGFVKHDLALSAAVAGVLVAAFPAGKALGSYAAGSAVDRIGERTVLAAGAAGCGAVTMLATPTPFVGLLVLLTAAGVFASSCTPAGGKLVLLAFPRARRGLAMGIRQTGIPWGGLLAALLLPWLASQMGWRTALLVAGALGLAGAAITALVAGVESRAERAEEADRRGAASPGARLSRERDLLLLAMWACLMVGGQYVVVAFLPIYVAGHHHISLTLAALVLVAVAQVGAIVGRVGWGAVSDRVFGGRRRPLLFVISSLGLVAFGLLGLLSSDAPLGAFVVAAFLSGLSVIGWQGLIITSIGEIAGPARAGAATGFVLTFISITITAAPPLYGLVADLAGGYRVMWLAIGAVVALAFLPALLVREPAPAGQSRRSP